MYSPQQRPPTGGGGADGTESSIFLGFSVAASTEYRFRGGAYQMGAQCANIVVGLRRDCTLRTIVSKVKLLILVYIAILRH